MKKLQLFILIILTLALYPQTNRFILKNLAVNHVYADDEEDEKDEEDEEDDDDEDEYKTKPTEEIIEVIQKPVIKYEIKYKEGYNVDTDNDGLVDAIDPDPKVHQKEYFTDSDGDSVPDVFDKYAGEDDFYYMSDNDINQNGILDSYEE